MKGMDKAFCHVTEKFLKFSKFEYLLLALGFFRIRVKRRSRADLFFLPPKGGTPRVGN